MRWLLLALPAAAAWNGTDAPLQRFTFSPLPPPELGAGDDPGDWDALNRLLSMVSIHIPDQAPSGTNMGLCTMHYVLSNLRCPTFSAAGPPHGDFTVHPPLGLFDAVVQSLPRDPAQKVQGIRMSTNTVHADCRGHVHVSCGFLSASADVHAWTQAAELNIEADFRAEAGKNFSNFPPTTANSPTCSCTPHMDFDLSGSIPGAIANTFKSLFRGTLNDAVGGALCGQLKDVINDDLGGLMRKLNNYIVPSMPVSNNPATVPHPLSGEVALQGLQPPPLLDFFDDDAISVCLDIAFVDTCVGLLSEGRTQLQNYLQEPDGSPGVNEFIRDHSGPGFAATGGEIFGHNHSFNVTMDWEFLNSTDPLSDIAVTVLNMTFMNLDQFDDFNVLLDAVEGGQTGHHTFRFTGHIPKVDVEVWTKIHMTPSGVTDPIIISQTEIIEITRGRSTVKDMHFDFSALLSVDYDLLMEAQMGRLYDDPVPCGLATVFEPGFNISALTVTFGDFTSPVIDHFICKGIEQVVSQLLDSAFIMYRQSVLLAAPGLAESTIRDVLNTKLHSLLQKAETTDCPALKPPPQTYVDFTSNSLFREVAKNVHDYLRDHDVNGLLDNVTKKVSGHPGVLNISGYDGGFDTKLGQDDMNLSAHLKASELGFSGISSVGSVQLLVSCPAPPTPPAVTLPPTPGGNWTAAPHAPTSSPTSSPTVWSCPTTGPFELYNAAKLAELPYMMNNTRFNLEGAVCGAGTVPASCREQCDWSLTCKGWTYMPAAAGAGPQCCLLCADVGEGVECPAPTVNGSFIGAWSGHKPVAFRGSVSIDLEASTGLVVQDDINFTLSMHDVDVLLQPSLQVAENRLRGLMVGQLKVSECLISTLEAGRLTELNLTFGNIQMAVQHKCRNCSAAHEKFMDTMIEAARTHPDTLGAAMNMLARKVVGVLVGAQSTEQLQKRVATAGANCAGTTGKTVSDWMPGVDIPGNDMRCFKASGVDGHVCQSACHLNLHCRAWSFYNDTTSENGTSFRCCLKDKISGTVRSNTTTSGVKPSPVHSTTKMPGWLVAVLATLGSILFVLGVVYAVYRCRREPPMVVETGWVLEGEEVDSHNDTDLNVSEQCCLGCRRACGRRLWGDGESTPLPKVLRPPPLYRDPALPRVARFLMPVLLAGTLALFASSHVSLGAAVDFEIKFAGDTLELREFTSFSIVHSVVEMWGAGAYPLALLVLCFSVIWPYTKIIILLAAWFAELPLGRRGSLLAVLDTLGKWSFIDVYVLVLSLIAFNMNVYSPYVLEDILTSEFYAVQSRVRPMWGLYSFMFGVLASLVLNLCITFCHEHARDSSQLPKPKSRVEPYVLCGPSFQQAAVLFLAVATVGLIGGASTASSFTFNVQGLAGIAMSAGSEGSDVTSYSLMDIIKKMHGQATENTGVDYTGMMFIVGTYFSISLLFPILHVAILGGGYAMGIMRWIGARGKRAVLKLHLVASAFSALPVYFVAIVVSLLEIGQVSDFMVGSACDGLDATFSDFLVPYGFILQSDATCFHIAASLDPGVGALLAAIIVKWVTCRWIVHQLRAELDSPDPLWDSAEKPSPAAGTSPVRLHNVGAQHVQEDDSDADAAPDAPLISGRPPPLPPPDFRPAPIREVPSAGALASPAFLQASSMGISDSYPGPASGAGTAVSSPVRPDSDLQRRLQSVRRVVS